MDLQFEQNTQLNNNKVIDDTNDQVNNLSNDQVNNLSNDQVNNLSNDQVNNLSNDQVNNLSNNQVNNLSNEQTYKDSCKLNSLSHVKLISYTKNANDDKNLEEIIVYSARVSNPASQYTNMNNDKLIKYLMDNAHWSPFEMASICLEINTTRDISRQILRHSTFSFQEFSQRYAKANLGFEIREARLQDNKNRQNSIETNDDELNAKWIQLQKNVIQTSLNAYEWALSNGIAKEQARVVLPEGNTMTKLYINGTLRSWIHYIKLRSGNGTQIEHKKIAIDCANAIKPIFPLISNFISV